MRELTWELKQINPADVSELRSAYELAKPGLERVRVKAKPSWIVEQVYAAIVAGRATLHIGWLDGNYAGCVVLALNTDPFSGERSLLVWALYTQMKQALFYGLRDVREIATKHGIHKIRFHSPREGWMRLMKSLGFEIAERVYEAEV